MVMGITPIKRDHFIPRFREHIDRELQQCTCIVEVANGLVLIHKFTVNKCNADGQIPLHVACTNPHAPSAVLQALVCAWPESVLQVDPSSEALFPWQLAQRARLSVSIVRWLHDFTEGATRAGGQPK